MLQSLIKHIDDLDNEYWEARELMLVLKYSKLEHFAKVINKAKISCKLSGINVNDHFPVIGKTIKMLKELQKKLLIIDFLDMHVI